MMDALSSHQ